MVSDIEVGRIIDELWFLEELEGNLWVERDVCISLQQAETSWNKYYGKTKGRLRIIKRMIELVKLQPSIFEK